MLFVHFLHPTVTCLRSDSEEQEVSSESVTSESNLLFVLIRCRAHPPLPTLQLPTPTAEDHAMGILDLLGVQEVRASTSALDLPADGCE